MVTTEEVCACEGTEEVDDTSKKDVGPAVDVMNDGAGAYSTYGAYSISDHYPLPRLNL